MSASTPEPARASEAADRGLRRLSGGAILGLAGGLLSIALPLALLGVITLRPRGPFSLTPSLLETGGILVFAGALLLILSLLAYRRAFAALRTVDRRVRLASALCLVGTLGFLLLVVTSALILGRATDLFGCVAGRPTRAITCLARVSPLGEYAGLAGFWLGWLGGLGIVLGLAFTGGSFRRRSLTAASGLYAVLLLALVGPFLALVVSVAGIEYLLFLVPVLVLLAPGLVLAGTLERPSGPARG